jgi:hypothetical protein
MADEERQQLNPKGEGSPANKDEEEDEGYSCKKCWNGYCGCIVWCCKGIYSCCVGIKSCFVNCCSACWYPFKERCCTCCDNCDKNLHPYTDEKHDPYDHL